MPYVVDFTDASAVGLESSPMANTLAGLRANEARYYKTKYAHAARLKSNSRAPSAARTS